MVAMLAFAVPAMGRWERRRQQHDCRVRIRLPVDARRRHHYLFELDSGTIGTPLVSISTKNTEARLTTTLS
jgi:hypothetical protein